MKSQFCSNDDEAGHNFQSVSNSFIHSLSPYNTTRILYSLKVKWVHRLRTTKTSNDYNDYDDVVVASIFHC